MVFKNAGQINPVHGVRSLPVAKEMERETPRNVHLRKEALKLFLWNDTRANQAIMEFRKVLQNWLNQKMRDCILYFNIRGS